MALEVARRVLEEFRDGAWLVELASLTDARLVPAAVAGVLGVPERPGLGLIETLSDTLRGAVQGLLGVVGVRLEPPEQKAFDRTSASMRARLGEDRFAVVYDRGRRMTLEDIIADALAPERDAPPQAKGDAAVLTAREREVAGLVAKGLTSREIAGHLVVSQRTVEGHVQAILDKLGFASRTQIAVWAVEHGFRDSEV